MDKVPFYVERDDSTDESLQASDTEDICSALDSDSTVSKRTRKESILLDALPCLASPCGNNLIESSQCNSKLPGIKNETIPVIRPLHNVLSGNRITICTELDERSKQNLAFVNDDGLIEKNTITIDDQWILKKPELSKDWEQISAKIADEKNDFESGEIKMIMTDKEKRVWFNKTLSSNLGIIYSIFLVTLGGIIYVWDVLETHEVPIAECFNIYLMIVQLIFLMYIHLDCKQYTSLIAKNLKKAENEKQMIQIKFPQDPREIEECPHIGQNEETEDIPQDYGFSSGRHGGSLYVKIGAAVFCFGYMIQGGLGLGQKVLYFINQEEGAEPCTSEIDLAMCALKLLYVFYKLFFIFKFSNLIINRRLYISHFGLMHCIGASLCFWVYNILQETFQSLIIPHHPDRENETSPMPVYYEHFGGEVKERTLNINLDCDDNNQLSNMINHLTPYLFPFSIEYNILMVGFWILLLENLGRIDRHTHIPSIEVSYEDDENTGKSLISNFLIYVDCHASMRGLFAGLMIMVFATISIILFYVLSNSDDTADIAIELTACTEMTIFLLMMISCLIVFYHMQELDIMTNSTNSSDDILLIGCLPMIFLYAMACAIPYIYDTHVITWFFNVTQIIQAIIQTALICDGLRRCSNNPSVRNKKPGREFIMFLVVANLAMWLMQTFQIKSKHGNSTAYDFYGKELWTLVSHFTLPFALFYRFHSSACFAMMWIEAYMEQTT